MVRHPENRGPSPLLAVVPIVGLAEGLVRQRGHGCRRVEPSRRHGGWVLVSTAVAVVVVEAWSCGFPLVRFTG